MTNDIKIDAMKMQQKLTSQSPIPYRVYYISKDGIQLGGTPLDGKFPWSTCQRFIRQILRTWAKDLISKHDEAQLAAILQRWAEEWSVECIPVDTKAAGEFTPLQQILTRLGDASIERKAFFRNQENLRDALHMFHLSEEMIAAINFHLNREGMRLRIQWEIESLPNGTGIYRIILERGENLEN